MSKFRINLFIIVVSLLFSIGTANGQSTEDFITSATSQAHEVDETIRMQARKLGLGDVHFTLGNTLFVVDDNSAVPYVLTERRDDGMNRIVMSAQLILAFNYFSELSALNEENGNLWQNCELMYSKHVHLAYWTMVQDSLAGHQSTSLMSPNRYAVEHGGYCAGLEKHYPIPKHLNSQIKESVTAAIATIYLHELAHLLYRDLPELSEWLDLSKPIDMRILLQIECNSRREEMHADQFAAKMLVDWGWVTRAFDKTLWTTLGSFRGRGENNSEIEQSQSTLNSYPRSLEFYGNVRASIEAKGLVKGLTWSQKYSDLISQITQLQQQIVEQLPLTQIPSSERLPCY